MMVIFLISLVIVILLRTLKKDLARYDRDDALLDYEKDFGDEYGWKQVHGDVFRPPPHLTFFSCSIGTGLQLTILMFIVIIYSLLGDFKMEYVRQYGIVQINRGFRSSQTISASLFLYALTSVISGYYAGSYYTRNGGRVAFIQNERNCPIIPSYHRKKLDSPYICRIGVLPVSQS
jgi:transmembrane 9 superfamily member 3